MPGSRLPAATPAAPEAPVLSHCRRVVPVLMMRVLFLFLKRDRGVLLPGPGLPDAAHNISKWLKTKQGCSSDGERKTRIFDACQKGFSQDGNIMMLIVCRDVAAFVIYNLL